MAMRVTLAPLGCVLWSKTKSPANTGPLSVTRVRLAPVTSMRTYGPAGTVTVTGVPATTTVSFTATVPVLMASFTVPPVRFTPGKFKLGLTVNEAARPCGVITSRPLPLLTERKAVVPSPNESERLVTATRTILVPTLFVDCSNTKFPPRLWPATTSVTAVPRTRT